jgi:hypothetical protein
MFSLEELKDKKWVAIGSFENKNDALATAANLGVGRSARVVDDSRETV